MVGEEDVLAGIDARHMAVHAIAAGLGGQGLPVPVGPLMGLACASGGCGEEPGLLPE